MTNNKKNLTSYEDVLAASAKWRLCFNSENAAGCAASYHPDATMIVTNSGTYCGLNEIEHFWKELIEMGAKEVCYDNLYIRVIDDNTVALSCDWSMNVAKGKVLLEKWRKQKNGEWLLIFDEFCITERNV